MTQCATCEHWQMRGGIVAPRAERCVALDNDRASERVAAIAAASARQLAEASRCPIYSPIPQYPDAYRSADL